MRRPPPHPAPPIHDTNVIICAPLIAVGLVKIDFGGGDAAIAVGSLVSRAITSAAGTTVTQDGYLEQWVLFRGAYSYSFTIPLKTGATVPVPISSTPWPNRLPHPSADAPDAQHSITYETLSSADIDPDAFFAEAQRAVKAVSNGQTAWYAAAWCPLPVQVTTPPAAGNNGAPAWLERIFPALSVTANKRIHICSAPYTPPDGSTIPAGAISYRQTHVLYQASKVSPPPLGGNLVSWATTANPANVTDIASWGAWAFAQIGGSASTPPSYSATTVWEFPPTAWLNATKRPEVP